MMASMPRFHTRQMKSHWASIRIMQEMKNRIIRYLQPVKRRSSQKGHIPCAGFRQAGMHGLSFMAIWCRRLPRHGRRSGQCSFQDRFSAILRNIKRTAPTTQRFTFISGFPRKDRRNRHPGAAFYAVHAAIVSRWAAAAAYISQNRSGAKAAL